MRLGFYLGAVVGGVLTATAAQAQPVSGPYVSADGGLSVLNPVNSSNFQSAALGTRTLLPIRIPSLATVSNSVTAKEQFRPSYGFIASAGYGFADGFRAELDFDYLRATAHRADFNYVQNGPFGASSTGSGSQSITGGQYTYGPMANLIYDLPVSYIVSPYIGAGAGYQWVKLNSDITAPSFTHYKVGGTQGSFAYDVVAGLSYPMPMVPGLALTAEYRFMQLTATRRYTLETPAPTSPFSPQPIVSRATMGQESIQTFMLGLRYQIP